jgi:hypothetical protein
MTTKADSWIAFNKVNGHELVSPKYCLDPLSNKVYWLRYDGWCEKKPVKARLPNIGYAFQGLTNVWEISIKKLKQQCGV